MIDVSEGTDVQKTNASKECNICHYWYFLDKGFKHEQQLCNGCHNLMQKTMNFKTLMMLLLFLLKEVISGFMFGIDAKIML